VTGHRVPDRPAHDQADAGRLGTVESGPHVQDECRAGRATSAPDSSGEVGAPAHPMGRGQHRSGSEAGAALTAARRQDRTAGTGAHPEPEAVGLGPAPVVGLERTLGHEELRGLTRWAGRGRPPLGRDAERDRQSSCGQAGQAPYGTTPAPGWVKPASAGARSTLHRFTSPAGGGGDTPDHARYGGLLVVDNRWTPPVPPGSVRPRPRDHRPPAVQSRPALIRPPTACG
jgi:hypothetical protein